MYILHARFLPRLSPICMPSRVSLPTNKNSVSELSWKFINSVLLVGFVCVCVCVLNTIETQMQREVNDVRVLPSFFFDRCSFSKATTPHLPHLPKVFLAPSLPLILSTTFDHKTTSPERIGWISSPPLLLLLLLLLLPLPTPPPHFLTSFNIHGRE